MLWADKVERWRADEVTKAYLDNLLEAVTSLQNQLIYEPDDRKVAVMQGMARAYLDMIETVEQGEIEQKEERAE